MSVSLRSRAPLRWLAPILLVTLIIGAAGADQGAAETHEFRYMMGTSIEVQAFGGDAATRKSAIEESELSLVNGRAAPEAVNVS